MVNHMFKHARACSRTLLWRIACSILSIVLSVAVISLSAYAYFSDTVASVSNHIRAARYHLTVTCADASPAADGVYTLDNRGGDTARSFCFTIEKARDATASAGYCRIQVIVDGITTSYYTHPIGNFKVGDAFVSVPSRTVTVLVPPYTAAQVCFLGEWGSCDKAVLEDEVLTAPSSPPPTTTATTTTIGTTVTTAATTTTTTAVTTVTTVVTTTTAVTTASTTVSATAVATTAATAETTVPTTVPTVPATTVLVTAGTTIPSF